EHPAERVGTRDAVLQREEPAEERLLGPAVLGDRLPRLGPADDRTRGDGQDIGQAVELVLGLPAWVGQAIEHDRKWQRRHWGSSRGGCRDRRTGFGGRTVGG